MIITVPVISIIASAARPQLWKQFYAEVIYSCTLPFEIVFVGPNPPPFDLPSNFRFIYSETKPPQCFEIACRNARGEFIMVATDDLQFPPDAINVFHSYIIRMWSKFVVIVARFSDNLDSPPADNLLYFDGASGYPVVGAPILVRKEAWMELGGLDRRFTRVYSIDDLQLRMYEAGGHSFIVPQEEFVVREKPHVYPRLIEKYLSDRVLLDTLWRDEKNNNEVKARLDTVQFFVESEVPVVT